MRTLATPLAGRPPAATQTARKLACATPATPSAIVARRGHTPVSLEGLTMRVARKTPAAKKASETVTLTTLGPPAPAVTSPRNTKFPVMKAVKTFPRPRKLMASTAPDETVNAISNRLRTLRSVVCPPVVAKTLHLTLLSDDNGLLFGEGSDRLLIEVQVRTHELRWCERYPLVEREVGEMVAAEHLQEAQRLLPRVLDVVAHSEGDVAHVARLVVEGPCLSARGENGHAPAPADVILPLVGVGVPVQLAHRARLHLHKRGRDGGRGREVGRVGDPDLPSCRLDRLLGVQAMAVGHGHVTRGRVDRVRGQRAGHLPGEDVARMVDVTRDVAKGGLGDAEVFGQYLGRRMSEPVGDEEGLVLREVAVVED